MVGWWWYVFVWYVFLSALFFGSFYGVKVAGFSGSYLIGGHFLRWSWIDLLLWKLSGVIVSVVLSIYWARVSRWRFEEVMGSSFRVYVWGCYWSVCLCFEMLSLSSMVFWGVFLILGSILSRWVCRGVSVVWISGVFCFVVPGFILVSLRS